MKKFTKITTAILWALTALSILAVGIYNIVDVNQACLWAWFLPAIVGLVAAGFTAIAFAVKKLSNKKEMLKTNN